MEDIEKDMKPKLIGETWSKYPTETSKQKARYGLYQCGYCEAEFEAMTAHIKSGNTKSCGCQKGGIIHGLSYNQFYKTWSSMVDRCNNPKNKNYKEYGGRGISVCTDWQDLANFVSWAEETYIEGMTMDRINNDGNYEPTNIRWADKTTQQLNQRIKKNNTSGFVGVSFGPLKNRWIANIGVNGKQIRIGVFKDKMEAALARDNYIIENNLPHKLSGLTKNEKEIK